MTTDPTQAVETPQPAPGAFQYPQTFPQLETSRLVLREHRPDDASRLFDLYSDPRVMEYDDGDPFTERDEGARCAATTRAAFGTQEQIRFALTLKGDDRLIGSVGLHSFEAEARRAEVGFDLLPEFWNRGLMTEALQAVCAWAFAILNLVRIEAQVSPGNLASCRLLAKVGFAYEGHLRNRDTFRDRWWDSLMFGLLEQDRAVPVVGGEEPAGVRFEVVEDPDRKAALCSEILATLPLWFGIPESNREYADGVRNRPFLAVLGGGTTVGFVSWKPNTPRTAELYVMGLRPEVHRRGLGTALVNRVKAELRAQGFVSLLVKTLDESRESEEYRRTRLFYVRLGFEPIDVLLGEWGPENPCLVMLCRL